MDLRTGTGPMRESSADGPAAAPDDRQVIAVLESVIDEPPDRAEAILRARCGTEQGLADAVRRLLALPAAGLLSAGPLDRLRRGAGHEKLPMGTVLGGYRLAKLIGHGAMAEVYEAIQDSTGQSVAVKVLHRGASRAVAQRFTREVTTLSRLRHPGIVRLLDAGIAPGGAGEDRLFIVMELVRGRPLDEYAAQLHPDNRIRVFIEACEVVQQAHLSGVIHRDLKPANILVDEQGQPRIVDFGVATALDPAQRATLRRTVEGGSVVGTLLYMSPEQLGGQPELVDSRTDVYALGAILWELLSGRSPWAGITTVGALVDAILHQPTPRLRESSPELAAQLDQVVARAMQKDPALRYFTPRALAEDLRRYLDGEPISGARPTMVQLGRAAWRRHRSLVLSGAAVGAVLVAASIVSARWAVQAGRSERRAQAASRDLLGLIRSLTSELFIDLLSLPRSTTALEQTARRAVETLERAAAGTSDDLESVELLADAYGKLGSVAGSPGMRNLGDLELSRSLLDRHVELSQRVTGMATDRAGAELSYALALGRRARVALDPAEQATLLERALELAGRVTASPGAPASHRSWELYLMVQLGDAKADAGDLAMLHRCVDIAALLAAAGDANDRATLLVATLRLAWHSARANRSDDAAALAERARTIIEECRLHGDSSETLRRHTASHEVLRSLCDAQLEAAPHAPDRCAAVFEAMRNEVRADPDDNYDSTFLAELLLDAAEAIDNTRNGSFILDPVALRKEAQALIESHSWKGARPWVEQRLLNRSTVAPQELAPPH